MPKFRNRDDGKIYDAEYYIGQFDQAEAELAVRRAKEVIAHERSVTRALERATPYNLTMPGMLADLERSQERQRAKKAENAAKFRNRPTMVKTRSRKANSPTQVNKRVSSPLVESKSKAEKARIKAIVAKGDREFNKKYMQKPTLRGELKLAAKDTAARFRKLAKNPKREVPIAAKNTAKRFGDVAWGAGKIALKPFELLGRGVGALTGQTQRYSRRSHSYYVRPAPEVQRILHPEMSRQPIDDIFRNGSNLHLDINAGGYNRRTSGLGVPRSRTQQITDFYGNFPQSSNTKTQERVMSPAELNRFRSRLAKRRPRKSDGTFA